MSEHVHGYHRENLAADRVGVSPLWVTCRPLPGGILMTVSGELDASNAGDLAAYIQREHRRPELPLVLELAGVSFMDSSGLYVLIEQNHRADSHGTKLHLAAPHERVVRVLEITGALQVLNTYDTLDEAMAAADLIDPHAVPR
ncbi:STAS domain-containing protein [Nonomuraea sp. NPDC050556]|uniref:STAS domain-containing protein n=1 Tax=Nonomuraea sp. NPDC050556 TaxID=3364369 RepID=UPI0037A8F102